MVGEFQSLNNCFSVEIVCVKISPKKKKIYTFFSEENSFPDQLCWAPDLSYAIAFIAVNKPSKEVCKN